MTVPKTSPAQAAAALRRALQQELLIGQQTAALAEEMTEAVVSGGVSRLSELELKHRQTLEQHAALEAARSQAVRDLSWALGFDRARPLSALLPKLPAREREALTALRAQILETQARLDTLNARNRYLLENALEFVRFSLDALAASAFQPARYGTNLAALAAPTFYIDSKA